MPDLIARLIAVLSGSAGLYRLYSSDSICGSVIVTDSLRRKESAARGVDSLSFPSLSIVAAA